MHRILMADDDREFCQLLAEYLGGHDFSVDSVHDGETAARTAGPQHEVIVLDVMMPKRDGFETLREIRQPGHPAYRTPILMLTARGEDIDRILGLEMGADDYLAKPCNPRELAARLRALIRRNQPGPANDAVLRAGSLQLNPAAREVRLDDQRVDLTSVEFEVLQCLLASAGSPVDRDQLMRSALGRRWSPLDRSLDMHIVSLRKKLGNERIKTLRGKGYQLVL